MVGVKVLVTGAASVTARALSQSEVSLHETMKLSCKALPESPLEPAWTLPIIEFTMVESTDSK